MLEVTANNGQQTDPHMKSERPSWFARREIAPFTLKEPEVKKILETASHAVESWVTKDSSPVTAIMLYVMVDGKVTVTSTTNRAKYYAWKRNPSTSFCIWDPNNIGRQVILRGEIEITQSDELLRKYTDGFLTNARNGRAPSPERLERELAKFDAPDRHMMQLNVKKILSHNLEELLKVEKEGSDVWS
jgi:hypothetical protein